MAANKLFAVFVMCIVVVAAMQLRQVEAAETDFKFKDCFNTCEKECIDGGQGNTFCEMKCDADCGTKEVADKLNINLN
ncbi:major pollen allergen Ole e 6-like isoform X2 [Tripterygium wilfordii]|uniref:major pollen allergen Ole e 6-like isoform X2 n=1 Tax=Tripterygium wilfordii TaxID=458696 RepID=UPI0018F84563|nr:major pollen allergen Ole e 6-like isoform X2 [Tripterygium wilfordii]